MDSYERMRELLDHGVDLCDIETILDAEDYLAEYAKQTDDLPEQLSVPAA